MGRHNPGMILQVDQETDFRPHSPVSKHVQCTTYPTGQSNPREKYRCKYGI